MDKKSVTETAADAAKVAVGIAAMAVDALMGADQTAEKDRSSTMEMSRGAAGNCRSWRIGSAGKQNSRRPEQSGDAAIPRWRSGGQRICTCQGCKSV